MDQPILEIIFLSAWTASTLLCLWLLWRNVRPERLPACYGYGVGTEPSARQGTAAEPNFYDAHRSMNGGK